MGPGWPVKEIFLADFANVSRRSFLRQTVAFSAMAALRPGALFAQAPFVQPNASAEHMFLIGDWGTDVEFEQQKAVAASMGKWMDGTRARPGAMFLLGDNWYGHLHGGLDDSRWRSQFEEMYPASRFPGPAYAVLGNHDYERTSEHDKVQLQLQYGNAKHSRWTMPSKWYSFTYPEKDPVITYICLDSNLPGTKAWDFKPGSYLMSREEADQQDAWFVAELSKPRTTPFLAVIAHHPLYTNGIHRDNRILIPRWDHLLRDHKVDFYITGHDHDLQHIEFDGHPTSFVISGGGGAELVNWSVPPENRGPYGGRVVGFSHLEMTKDAVVLRHIGANAQQLHAFRKLAGGKTEILKS